MADYTSAADVRAMVADSGNFSTDTSYDTLLGTYITAASRLIDRYVGGWDNYFYPSTDAETRYYDGQPGKELDIEPLLSLTSVSVSEYGYTASTSYTDWTENSDFYVWPYNCL